MYHCTKEMGSLCVFLQLTHLASGLSILNFVDGEGDVAMCIMNVSN